MQSSEPPSLFFKPKLKQQFPEINSALKIDTIHAILLIIHIYTNKLKDSRAL